jgi:hypothetical protein
MIQINLSVRSLVIILVLGVALFAGSDVARGAPAAANLDVDNQIRFTAPGFNVAHDINVVDQAGALRFYGCPELSNPPNCAAIQFFGNHANTFGGQAFIDSGATSNAAIIFRTATDGQGLTERMRISAQGQFTMGSGAAASRFGEQAIANGSFSTSGDAQVSTFVVRWEGIAGGHHELLLDGAGQRITVPVNHTLAFDVQGVIRTNFDDSMIFTCEGVIENVDGTTALVPGPTVTCSIAGENFANMIPRVDASDAFDSLTIGLQVINSPTALRTVAVVRTVEVGG